MSPGEILWDVGTVVVIWILARKVNRWRSEAARWHRLAELNIRAHLVRSGEVRASERLASRVEDGVIPAELLEKLGTLRPGRMARLGYSRGGYMADPWAVAKAKADLDRKIAAKMGENEATPEVNPKKGNDHE